MQLLESPKENNKGTTKADKTKTPKETKELIESEMRENPTKSQELSETDFQAQLLSMIREMDSKLSGRLDQIDKKFSGMFLEMKTDIRQLKENMTETTDKLNDLVIKVDDMEESIEHNAKITRDIKQECDQKQSEIEKKLMEKIKLLEDKLKLLEKHDRKYNLLFYGIQETENEKVVDKLRTFFKSDLKIDKTTVDNMRFTNGHRIPSKGPGPKPIILRFTSHDDLNMVLSNSYRLAGTKKRILIDLPLEMKQERARLAKEAFNIRRTEEKQTRILVRGLDVFLQVRNNEHSAWVRREI